MAKTETVYLALKIISTNQMFDSFYYLLHSNSYQQYYLKNFMDFHFTDFYLIDFSKLLAFS